MSLANNTVKVLTLVLMVTLPVSLPGFFSPGEFLWPYTFKLISALGNWEGTTIPEKTSHLSDSFAQFVLVGWIFLFSCLISCFYQWIKPQVFARRTWTKHYHSMSSTYLAIVLLVYGLSKVFKHQFYLPEPNTLYLPMGQAPPNLLYWSLMGTSYGYSVLLGALEVLTAGLLIFRSTRTLGALFSLIIFAQIASIDFAFHISVKLFVLLLLLIALQLAAPFWRTCWTYLKGKAVVIQRKPTTQKSWIERLAKGGFWFFTLLLILFPYLFNTNFNDDNHPRPLWHGAYQVEKPAELKKLGTVKRFFVHRKNALIFQTTDDIFYSYDVLTRPGSGKYGIYDQEEKVGYLQLDSMATGIVQLSGNLHQQPICLEAAPLAWRKLPLLNTSFSWTLEGYQTP